MPEGLQILALTLAGEWGLIPLACWRLPAGRRFLREVMQGTAAAI